MIMLACRPGTILFHSAHIPGASTTRGPVAMIRGTAATGVPAGGGGALAGVVCRWRDMLERPLDSGPRPVGAADGLPAVAAAAAAPVSGLPAAAGAVAVGLLGPSTARGGRPAALSEAESPALMICCCCCHCCSSSCCCCCCSFESVPPDTAVPPPPVFRAKRASLPPPPCPISLRLPVLLACTKCGAGAAAAGTSAMRSVLCAASCTPSLTGVLGAPPGRCRQINTLSWSEQKIRCCPRGVR